MMLPKFGLCSPVTNRNAATVLGEVEKNSFIALPGKGGHGRLTPSKLCVPHWRCSEESFSVQGAAHDQLMDILLIGW